MIRTFLLLLAFAAFAVPASAQFNSGSSGGGGGGFGIQDQPDNVTDTFAGLTFQVQRLVRDPSTENAFRLILRVIETEKTGRRVALIGPAATLVDELGNVYYVANSTGVPICSRKNLYDVDVGHCAYYKKEVPVTMTPSQPMPVVFTVVPYESSFSADLAGLATTASLTARFAIYSNDLSEQMFYDVVINGIELPGGNS